MNNKYTREFLKLVQENPELEIIPIVFSDDTEDYEEHLRDVLWDKDDTLNDDEVDRRVDEVIDAIEWQKVITVSISTPLE